jgi:nucleoside-diphosphate-sugar epimerase
MNNLSQILQDDASFLVDKHGNSIACNSNILITGASGLIGINLLSFFISAKLKEKKLKIFITLPSEEGLNFIKSVYPDENINILNISLDDISITNINISFDYIFHLATYGQPNRFTAEASKTMHLNSIGIIKLFELLSPKGIFFFCSSSEVYSGNENFPHKEEEIGTTNTVHPRACYIEGKRFGEAYCYLMSQQGFKTYSGRISLSYGPGFRINDKRVLNEFIFNGILKKEIKMLDDGSAVRVYCYVRDTIDMILGLIQTDHFKPINFCGKEQISILNLGKLVSNECSCNLVAGPKNSTLIGAPQVVSSSPELITNLINKNNFVSMPEGIKNAVRWAKLITEYK